MLHCDSLRYCHTMDFSFYCFQVPSTKPFWRLGVDWDLLRPTLAWVRNPAPSREGTCPQTPTLRNAPSTVRSAMSESTLSCSLNRWGTCTKTRGAWQNYFPNNHNIQYLFPFHFLLQHISSRRHRDGVAGKPNPLLSRHKKRTDFMVRPRSVSYSMFINSLP